MSEVNDFVCSDGQILVTEATRQEALGNHWIWNPTRVLIGWSRAWGPPDLESIKTVRAFPIYRTPIVKLAPKCFGELKP